MAWDVDHIIDAVGKLQARFDAMEDRTLRQKSELSRNVSQHQNAARAATEAGDRRAAAAHNRAATAYAAAYNEVSRRAMSRADEDYNGQEKINRGRATDKKAKELYEKETKRNWDYAGTTSRAEYIKKAKAEERSDAFLERFPRGKDARRPIDVGMEQTRGDAEERMHIQVFSGNDHVADVDVEASSPGEAKKLARSSPKVTSYVNSKGINSSSLKFFQGNTRL